MISKNEALEMVKNEVDNENLRKHMYAVGAIMRDLADELDKDRDEWEVLGLVHDIDYEKTKDNPEKHALLSAEMLESKLEQKYLHAVKAHNFKHTDVEPISTVDNALIAADGMSGLIVATALVMPNSKIKEARPESVQKKFKDNSFAKNIDRDKILYCEKVGLSRDEFIELSLGALKKIDNKLGL